MSQAHMYGAEFHQTDAVHRLLKLDQPQFVTLLVGLTAMAVANYLYVVLQLQPSRSQLLEENKSLRQEIQQLRQAPGNAAARQSTDSQYFVSSMLEPTTPATPNTPATAPAIRSPNSLGKIVWLVIIILSVVYLGSVYRLFTATDPNAVAAAGDMAKTLTGFFCGLVMGLLGLS